MNEINSEFEGIGMFRSNFVFMSIFEYLLLQHFLLPHELTKNIIPQTSANFFIFYDKGFYITNALSNINCIPYRLIKHLNSITLQDNLLYWIV